MNSPTTCPSCQNPIPPDAPGGICPACALMGAAEPTLLSGGPPGSFPSIAEVAAAFPELEILEVLGQGGMGIVFKARQPRIDRLVALKILPPHLAAQPGFAERFTREARALAKLSHPHIVTVYDFGESGGFLYLLMEFVNGVNLRKAMKAGVKPEQALSLVPDICEALQFAHDNGVLHRDIKPENILLDVKGVPKLADFGIAKLAGDAASGLTLSGAALGTAAYMAPEQIEKPGAVDHRADIYSLGVVLYEMLTGELPLGRFAAPSRKSTVSEGVDDVVMRALEKERDLRQQSAFEMKTQVEGAAAASASWRAPATTGTRAGQAGRKMALVGAWIHLLPVILAICFLPLWFRIAAVVHENPSIMPGSVFAGYPELYAFLVPSALSLLLGIVFTFVAAMGYRYRSPAYFYWLIIYGLATSWLVFGLVILAYTIVNRREFFEQRKTGPSGESTSAPTSGSAALSFESISKRVIFGAPLYHIVRGPDPKTGRTPVARGIFAYGPVAKGFFAAGGRAHGVFAMGGIATGVVAFGGITFGLFAIGGMALGLLCALGGLAVGPLVLGGAMFGAAPFGADSESFQLRSQMIYKPLADPLGPIPQGLHQAALFSGIGILCLAGLVLLMALMAPKGEPRQPNPWRIVLRVIICLIVILGAMVGPAVDSVANNIRRESRGRETQSYQTTPAMDVVRDTQPGFTGKWNQGSVQLTAITRHPSSPNSPWWRMDGLPAREGPFTSTEGHVFDERGQRAYEFVFHIRDLPPGASDPKWLFENATAYAGGGSPALLSNPNERLSGYYSVAAALPESNDRANTKVGVATEPWTTLTRSAPNNSTGAGGGNNNEEWQVAQGAAIEAKNGDLVVNFTAKISADLEDRVVAVNLADEEITTTRRSRINQQSEWRFPNLPIAQVKEFRFQTRRYEWVEFRGITLK